MKKVGLIVVMVMMLPAGLFAGGDMEEGIDTGFYDVAETSSSGFPKVNISYEQSGGRNYIYLNPKNWNVDYGIVKVIEDGQTVYRSVDKEAERLTGLDWNQYYDNTTPPSVIVLTDESADTFTKLVSLSGSVDTTSDISLIRELSTGYDNNPLKSYGGIKASVVYEDCSVDKEYDLLLFNENKNEYLRLRFIIKTEFFNGEKDLFESISGTYTYEEKAISFLGRVLGSDFISSFSTLNTGYSGIDWDLFDPGTDQTKIDLLKRYQADFKRKTSLHFEHIEDGNWEEGYPSIDTAAMFEGIYGTKKNIYINTYLKFIYTQNKPALSEIYTDLFNNEHKIYNYTNYRPLTGVEGELLAKNAMRYYTWGVEYTPFAGYNTIVKTEGMNDVWEGFGDEPDLQAWIASGTPGERADNYAAAVHSLSSESTPPVNVPTYSSNGVDNVTLKTSSHEAVEISRIDLWSASNLAWDDTVGKIPLLYKVNAEFPWIDNSIEYTLTNEQKDFLDDGDLYKEDAGNPVGSIKLIRDSSKGIGVGYEFTDGDRSVQSLLVIKGRSPDANAHISGRTSYPELNKVEDAGVEYYSIYYADGSNNWIKLEPSEYIECVTDNENNNYTFYPETKDRKPGYGIWNEYFSNEEEEIVYSYLIFKYPIECTKILLVDRSGNDYLSITELGVFEADPLQHLNHEGVQAVEIAGELVKEISWTDSEVTGFNTVSSNLETVMINGNPGTEYIINDSSGYINIQAKTMAPLRHLIAWTADDTNKKLSVQDKIFGLAGDTAIQDNEFFIALTDLGQQETWDGVKNIIDTPYLKKNFLGITISKSLGNPLPYVPGGIDSPRTFAYKMTEQMDARNAVKRNSYDSTVALDGSYEQGYVRKEDFTVLDDNKPFLPGFFILNGTGGYDDSFRPEMTAGVDDIGIVQGAMAMMENVNFTNIAENNLTADLDSFYSMDGTQPGLGTDNLLAFTVKTDGSNSYENILRMTPADIEKISIIVPDISFIQPGDILVRNTEENKHLGIIAGFKGTPPTTATSAPDWWENILVLSTRPGFQSATLGTWGNPNGFFGGFTEYPEEYIVRRLMKVSSEPVGDATEDWESVKSIYYQGYEDYVIESKVPFYAHTFEDSVSDGTVTQSRQNKFLLSTLRYYKEFPPTSYFSNRVSQPLFDSNTSDNVIEPMRPTSYTGWRDLTEKVKYHRGLDVKPSTSFPDVPEGGQTSEIIRAPEDGKYWIVESVGTNEYYLQIDNENFLILERFREDIFGDIGVLVTNPDNPRNGRIYLFMHLYFQNDSSKGITGMQSVYSDNANIHFSDGTGGTRNTLPTAWNTGGYVKAGDWLGQMAGNPDYPAHAHIEVYEYFSDYEHGDAVEQKPIGDVTAITYDEIKDKIFTLMQISTTTDIVKNSILWQRVDPRTVFGQELINEIDDDNNDTENLINNLKVTDIYWTGVLNGNATRNTKIDELFEEWTKWTKVTAED